MEQEINKWLKIMLQSNQIVQLIDAAVLRAAYKHSPMVGGALNSDKNTLEITNRMITLTLNKAKILDMTLHTVSTIESEAVNNPQVTVLKSKYISKMSMNDICNSFKLGKRQYYRWLNKGVKNITGKLLENKSLNNMVKQGTDNYFKEIVKNFY